MSSTIASTPIELDDLTPKTLDVASAMDKIENMKASASPNDDPASISLGPDPMSRRESELEARSLRGEEGAVELHPVDGGFHAWLFVFCAFMLESLVWGFGFSYGIFQDWYLKHEFKGASEASINSVGTVALAIQYSEGIIMLMFAKRYGKHLRKLMVGSLAVCVLSMFASSFATQVWQLILLQGVVYGIAAGFLYTPVISWLSEWFVARRSLAGSLIFGGSGLGGAVFPLIMTYLLENVGFRWALRVWSAMLLVLGGLAILGTKPRLPVAPTARIARPDLSLNMSFLKDPLFIAVASTIFVQGLAYFCVSLYIPSYASALGYSQIQGTIALSVFNLASVAGQIVFGYYCDIRPFTGVMIFSGLLSSILAWGLWGFAHSLSTVYVFIVAFASISGGFSSIWPPASSTVAVSQPSLVFFCFAMVKGASAVTGPLVAAALHPSKLSSASALRAGKGGWGGYGFTGITIFVGCAMAATAAMSVLSAFLRQRAVTSLRA
ncbi:MFS general substrate transporter [Clavulina sp. PMI_390]|nr:MFS general substrate transporter [Clavulina sp. PMI_390]